MRRASAAVLLGISMWLGSLAWSGFLLLRTVLDPDRSQQVAGDIYDNEVVRDAVAANIADRIEQTLPDGAPVDRATIEAAAHTALESPAVRAVVVDAFARSHQAFLGEGEPPESLDAGAFGAAARDALVQARPDLEPFIPAAPQLAVDLPTERIPDASPVRSLFQTAVPLLAALSGIGAIVALVVAKNRPALLRRAGFWALGLSAFALAFAFGIPALAESIAPDQAAVVAALVAAIAEATRAPAVALAAAGAAALAASVLWRAAPAALGGVGSVVGGGDPDVRGRGATANRDIPRPYRRVPSGPGADSRTGPSAGRGRPDDGYRPGERPPPDPHPGYPDRRDAPRSRPPRATGPGAIPDRARWVPGVGYVEDD